MRQHAHSGATSAASVLYPPLKSLPPSLRTTARTAEVLIVDDDPVIRAWVRGILTSQGYGVWTAANGLEALAILGQALPALVILDMYMPGMDGWQFTRALEQRCIHLPVLVMTAATDGQRWASELGAAGCVSKPFDLRDLLAEVENVIPRGWNPRL